MTQLLKVAFALVAAFVLAPGPAFAAVAPTLIVTSGQGTATAAPDMAALALTIETNARSATAAASENNRIYNRLVSSLASIGVVKERIQTQSYSMYYNPPPPA